MKSSPLKFSVLLFFICGVVVARAYAEMQIGAAKINVTPDFPVWLNGYAARASMATNTGLKLWAKALAIGSDAEGPALFMTVDNCGVSAEVTTAVAERLRKKANIPRERIVLCSTHTHAAPCITGVLPNLLSRPFTAEEQRGIDQYTAALIDKLEQVALSALGARQSGTLSWAQGSADFARNRRTTNGPTDHALPVIKAVDDRGRLVAVVAAYACHCTTLGGDYNQFHGDWAGEAGAAFEKGHPGTVALISLGCGADANPSPRGTVQLAREHGAEIVSAIDNLL
ncbi:MAG TPA: neutral/alkaline non-lysosomal ceramidase N-terminal domain-containing protein, partial [Candidatus Saccharimonadales bacterium]|nr:neutral/alkaline non-lysosomal ceramidase N-terminal domain-containing protein [Candidatus Saccharimonadales bacterium]